MGHRDACGTDSQPGVARVQRLHPHAQGLRTDPVFAGGGRHARDDRSLI